MTIIGEIFSGSLAILRAKVPDGTIIYDEFSIATPNYVNYTIKAFLLETKSPASDANASQPRNRPATWLEGYITEVTDAVGAKMIPRLPATINDSLELTIGKFSGRFYPHKLIPCPAIDRFDLYDLVGEELKGWFECLS
jgi:hypothetical protein